jgi:twinkle protein
MPSHGKSEFMDALAMNLVTKDRWKIAVFSPENYPVEMHYHKLIEKLNGKGLRDLKDYEIELSIKAISEFFFFIDALEEDISLDSILAQTEILIKEKGIDGLVIDPWNEIELSKPKDINDSDFIGVCLRRLRKFARRWNIHLWIVAHPTKMQKDKNGVYPIPELYDIQGSSHWRNKADNGICVHRDFENNTTQIHVQKIKFRYAGKQGMVVFKYREKDGNYEEVDKSTIDYSENRF